MSTEKPPFRSGDHVFHAPSEETWVVAYADPVTGYMSYCGWPQGEAKISDCTLTKAASEEVHQRVLRALKESGGTRAARALRLYGDPAPEPTS